MIASLFYAFESFGHKKLTCLSHFSVVLYCRYQTT